MGDTLLRRGKEAFRIALEIRNHLLQNGGVSYIISFNDLLLPVPCHDRAKGFP